MSEPANGALPPGSTIGVLGGGQLGRMLAISAAELGLKCHIYCPDQASPAFDVAVATTVAAYEDQTALFKFAAAVDVVTYEFENVPAKTVEHLAASVPVRPGVRALTVSQDRLTEKMFLKDLGAPVGPFFAINTAADLHSGLLDIHGRGVLKTRRFGYDGKGQATIRSDDDLPATERLLEGGQACILEALIDFDEEVSVIAARSATGAVGVFELGDNTHKNHILHTTTLPSRLPDEIKQRAVTIATEIVNALEYIGVIGVEFFVTLNGDGPSLLVNEVAPRVHNSGHWTQDAAVTSQFEQHIRAICGWPLGSPERSHDIVMENLIGDDVAKVPDIITQPNAKLHLYGKSEVRPGRKMGHVNWLGSSAGASRST